MNGAKSNWRKNDMGTMDYRKITAIIRPERLEATEEALKQLCVPGMSITRLQGYGEERNYFRSDWTSSHARIEIFIEADRVQQVINAVVERAQSGCENNGIIAVLPVESFQRICVGNNVE